MNVEIYWSHSFLSTSQSPIMLAGERHPIRLAQCPARRCGASLLGTTINGLRSAVDSQNPGRAVLGMLHGYGDIVARRIGRLVASCVYRLNRRLKKSGLIALAEIEAQLPKSSDTTS